MSNRKKSVSEKAAKPIVFFIVLASVFASVANGQKAKCKKWTYDFSEVVKYSDTPLEACKNYVKEKYPNDNHRASVEATNDAETYRCSADDTYIGLVYKRECDSCCNKPSHARTFQLYFEPQQFISNSPTHRLQFRSHIRARIPKRL